MKIKNELNPWVSVGHAWTNERKSLIFSPIPPRLMKKMDAKNKTFLAGISILIGTAIGAGVLGIPYVVAK